MGMLEKIIVAEGREKGAVQKILQLAAKNGIPVEWMGRGGVEKLAPGLVHQGIVGLCREHAYASVDEVLANRHKGSRYSLVILLDGITDPQNLGSIIRTAHCCGANGVIIPENRSASVTASVAKASAGAVYRLPTAMVVNMARTIDDLKERGFWIYGAAGEFNCPPGATTDPANVACYNKEPGTFNRSVSTRLIARSCLNCHNAIHGSNAPGARGKYFIR